MTINLTKTELMAVIWAVRQHAQSNANDVNVMMAEGLSRSEAKALNMAEYKLLNAGGFVIHRKQEEVAA